MSCRAWSWEIGLFLALEFGDDALGKHLPQFDSPLVERVNLPDGALSENAVFVQRDELPQRRRSQPLQQDRVGRTVALEGAVRHEPGRRAFGLDFLRRFAKGQRLRLGKNVGQQDVVVPAERVQRLGKRDEVAGDELGPLMDQLVEGMLAIGARLPPVDRPGLVATSVPSSVTCLPLLSIVNCWR
jgi:hypothetical protein